MLSCAEEGILTQDTNPNAEPYEVKKSIHLCVANETMQEQQLRVEWSLRNNRSEILRSGSEEVTVSPLSSLWLEKTAVSYTHLMRIWKNRPGCLRRFILRRQSYRC